MKKLLVILPVFFFLPFLFCTYHESETEAEKEIEYQLPPTLQSTSKIRYHVEGGGNIDFVIENKSDSISILVLHYQFQDKYETFIISKQETDSADMVLLEAMFRGSMDIGGIIYKNDLATGSWTYMYIDDNSTWLRVANEIILNELSSLYFFVVGKMDMEAN